MNTITLHMENRADNTAVSNYFIDTLMPQANGEFVKIYLYLLRCVSAGHISLSVSEWQIYSTRRKPTSCAGCATGIK